MRLLVLAAALGAAVPAVALAAAPAPSVQRGHEVFDRWCAPCHAPGPGHPGTQSLEAKYKGSKPGALEQRTDLTLDAGLILLCYRMTKLDKVTVPVSHRSFLQASCNSTIESSRCLIAIC